MSSQKLRRAGGKLAVLCIFLLCMACEAYSQNDASQTGSSFKLRVDVDLVTIEVSAFDKNGQAALNLKKEDFRLYEDGKKQEILSFDTVSSAAASSPKEMSLLDENRGKRGKTVLIVFMEQSISPRNLKLAHDSIANFVMKHMHPQDLFAVMSFGSSMKILQNLTGERDEVMAAVHKLAPSMVVSFSFDDFLRSFEQINYSIARIKGQKSILVFGPPGLGYAPMDRSRYNKAINSARQSNVVFYAADPERIIGSGGYAEAGRSAGTPMGPASLPHGVLGTLPGTSSISTAGGLVPLTLKTLAAETGGSSIDNVLDIDSELDRLDQQLSNFYVLGFQSNNPKRDGSFRKIEVKMDMKGVTLRHREGYVDKSPIDVLASSRQERSLLTALASPAPSAQLPIYFRPMYFYDSSRMARVMIEARVKLEKIAFQKKAGRIGVDLNIMGIAYTEDGAIAARFSETLPVNYDKDDEAEFRARSLAYRNYFRLRPGKYRLKLAVSDGSEKIGSTERSLEIPTFPEKSIIASSVVIAEQTSQLPELIRNLQSQMLDQRDPLIYAGVQVAPGVENRLRVDSAVRMLFRLYNLSGGSEECDLIAKAKLVDEKGGETALTPIYLKKLMDFTGAGEAGVGLALPLKGIASGKYRLTVEIIDAFSPQTTAVSTDIEIIG
jgi:VWFA-related protein